MTVTNSEVFTHFESRETNIWFCKKCKLFHVKAGAVVLSFDREEFSDFVNQSWDCLYQHANRDFAALVNGEEVITNGGFVSYNAI